MRNNVLLTQFGLPFLASTITGSIGVASLRPTFLTSFFDRLHITLDSFFTGSRSQDATHKLEGSELERHKAHVDEMYTDFKNRVIEGRGIHPELIELVAGGRVMTGLKAFTLNAPPELISQIKGLEPTPADSIATKSKVEGAIEVIEAVTTSEKAFVAQSPLEESEKKSNLLSNEDQDAEKTRQRTGTIVEISEDQDMSPFAPPESTTVPYVVSAASNAVDQSPVSVPGTSQSADPAEINAKVALQTSTPEEQEAPVRSTRSSGGSAGTVAAAGIYEVQPGPFGRGLIDGLGGIRDAAVYACELFVSA